MTTSTATIGGLSARDYARVSHGLSVEGERSQARGLFYLCAFVIVASLILGGGTRGGFLSDAILQFLAIPLLLVALWKLFDVSLSKQARIPLLLCLALVLIPVIQLIPLPPFIWTNLPGRETSVETFEILGGLFPWMPISVAPSQTWLSALSLIPPLGIFLATLQLSYRDRRWLTWVFLGIGVISVFIGLVQVAQGPESVLRFFAFTNKYEAVGFFANRNHFAALLYCLTLLAVAWAIHASTLGQADGRHKLDAVVIVAMIGTFTLLVILLAGEMMARSRAGLALTIVALFGAVALGASDRRIVATLSPVRLLVGAAVLVLVFASQFAVYRVMQRFVVDPFEGARLPVTGTTLEAALSYLPFGSGLGTFVPVYAMVEKSKDVIAGRYMNHAHNDWAELWLDTGLVGLTLAGMFIAWLMLRSVQIWRSAPPPSASELDWDLARAATLIVALLIVHSFLDYPLRTGAMMAVMAFACALLIEPPLGAEPPPAKLDTVAPQAAEALLPDAEMTPSLPVAQKPASPPAKVRSEGGPLSPDARWGADLEWPEEWSRASESGEEKPSTKPNPPKKS